MTKERSKTVTNCNAFNLVLLNAKQIAQGEELFLEKQWGYKKCVILPMN